MTDGLVLHTITPSKFNGFFSKVPEIWNRQEIQGAS